MYMDNFKTWKNDLFFDKATRTELQELENIKDYKEIEERFYKDLEFGTGGLRGIMGAGTNRMNKYTVGKATVGLGNFLIDNYGIKACMERGVVIAFDTRNNSSYFASVSADILTGMGIKVSIFDNPAPTPQLSFAVTYLDCIGGIVVTASHNPKEYNGYKVYDDKGGQLVPWQAKKVISSIDKIEDITTICFDGNDSLKHQVDITDEFVSAVLGRSLLEDLEAKKNLAIVYTPLHGAGNIPVRKTLERGGFENVAIVLEQELPDGDFPTLKSPNPEERNALNLGIKLAEINKADIILGTDPDSDRVGAGVRSMDGTYKLLTGNQIGALLMDYVLSHTDLRQYKKPAIVKTVVTSELGAEIAKKYGLTVFSTLTGFKFIGEKITQFEQAKKSGDENCDYDFILGYEESYGYLSGTYARDKDAVVSCLLICEMAAEYKKRNITLLDRLNQIYEEFGHYQDALDSFTLEGKEGLEQIISIMKDLRESESPFENTKEIIDYSIPVKAEEGFGMLPTSDVLKYILKDGSWIAIRPSGTEPKIKIYYSVKGISEKESYKNLLLIQDTIKGKMKLR